jgi:hypothetical protein
MFKGCRIMERSRNYADPAKTTYIPAGPLTFGIEYRHLQNDQGICIHVFGDLWNSWPGAIKSLYDDGHHRASIIA